MSFCQNKKCKSKALPGGKVCDNCNLVTCAIENCFTLRTRGYDFHTYFCKHHGIKYSNTPEAFREFLKRFSK